MCTRGVKFLVQGATKAVGLINGVNHVAGGEPFLDPGNELSAGEFLDVVDLAEGMSRK